MREMRGYGNRIKKAERSDMIWGVTLGIGLPFLVFIFFQMVDPFRLSEEKFEENLGGQEEIYKKTPPISPEHAKAVITKIESLYSQNYQNLFLPRFQRDDNSREDRINEFNCLRKVYVECNDMLVFLKQELKRKDCMISNFTPRIEQLDQLLSQAGQQVDDLNPIPAGLRKY